jgi:hypothetical protein
MDDRPFNMSVLGDDACWPRDGIFRATFSVGRKYKCTMTLDCGALVHGASGRFCAEWEPCLPRRLSKAEMRDYRSGRDAFLAAAAEAVGGNVLVVET